MTYPDKIDVKEASRYRICEWYRFLPSAENDRELEIMNYIVDRWKELGGFTPEISKSIGWDPKKY